MAFSATDLANIRAAISAILARMATGSRETISATIGNNTVQYESSLKSLESLRAMEASAAIDVGLADGSYVPRTYARQGGRGQ